MGINAIVVDDNKELLTCFVELLQFSNINVIGTGHNGKEAAELYQKHRPDILFMDIEMPQYDGLYGLQKIKEYDPNATVVLVSGSVNVESKLEEYGATAVLPKPFNMKEIKDLVNRVCIH
jgi:two-component system, chemotaxis family, chemotaxis protein CheY